MTQTQSGFEIAEADLRLRGPGDFFGTRQHGLPAFKLADITEEIEMLKLAREDALALLLADPNLKAAENEPLRKAIAKQFGESLFLAQVG
jgi:ATP-dependent DNA helicase RecG